MHLYTTKIEKFFFSAFVSAMAFGAANSFAETKSSKPPLERYTCHQVYAPSQTFTYMGHFTLQAGNKYVWGFNNDKETKRGRYAYDVKKGIHFLDGPLKGIKGEFTTEKNGRHSFELKIQGKKQYESDDGIITWYGNCDPHDPYEKKKKDKK